MLSLHVWKSCFVLRSPNERLLLSSPDHTNSMARDRAPRSWWDREIDSSGKALRADVRLTASDIWERVCNQTESVLGESTSAAELMEQTVAQASAYLDRIGVALHSKNLTGLLLCTFWRVLNRHAQKLKRLQLVGSSAELSHLATEQDWSAQVDARIDYERIVRLLSDKCRMVLALRDAGYDWQEIAELLGTTATAIRKSFFREIQQLQKRLQNPVGTQPTA